jgi:epoxyqueuosine reductase
MSDSATSIAIKSAIRAKALATGFDAVGFSRAAGGAELKSRLDEFLNGGRHAGMDWMARNAEIRADPSKIFPEARSIIVLGLNYGPGDVNPGRSAGAISVYARGRNYHKVIKKKLKHLARWLGDTYGAQAKVFADTAPVMEKPLAQQAGLGWQGKHTNLVSRQFGSWLFLGEIFTTLEVEPDGATEDLCGTCEACIRACPTGAITEPYRLDAGRCISYLTIEHKAAIDDGIARQMGNRIFGCDDCLAACPWNKFARPAAEEDFAPRPQTVNPELGPLLALDDAAYRETFAGTPLRRPGRDRFLRNVLVAAGNSGDKSLAEAVRASAGDPAALVRAAARWALARLDG